MFVKTTIQIEIIDGDSSAIVQLGTDQARRLALQLRDLCTNGVNGESVLMRGTSLAASGAELIATKEIKSAPPVSNNEINKKGEAKNAGRNEAIGEN